MPEFQSKWRERFEKRASGALTKPTKAPFGSFVGDLHRHPEKNEEVMRNLWGQRFIILTTPPEALETLSVWPWAAFIRLEDKSVLLVENVVDVLTTNAPVRVLWEAKS